MFGRSEHQRLLVRSRARVGDTRFERSMPRHRLRCDCGRRSCDIGNHGSARLFGDAIELDLWRCVYCATRRSSTPTLHQNLMHGRKRTEGGCTVEDLPYMDDSRDALKSPLSSRYDPPPIALAVSPTNRKAPFAMFCRESPPWKSPVMFGSWRDS